jgi:hypothetical protein
VKLPCKFPRCGERRIHHDRPDEPRGTQLVEVPDTTSEYDPVFCSYTCAIADGWMCLRYETAEETEARQVRWREKDQLRCLAARLV